MAARRQILILVFTATLLLAMLTVLTVGLLFAAPQPITVTVGAIEDFPPAHTPYRIDVGEFKAWIVNTGDALIVLNPFVSHQDRFGCDYKWVPANRRFEAPCCLGMWEVDGSWLGGPTQLDLNRYAYEIIDGEIIVYPEQVIAGAPAQTRINSIDNAPDEAVSRLHQCWGRR